MLIRRPLLYIAPAAIVGLAVAFLARFQALGPVGLYLQDFVEYWAAGHLNASGQNPYDRELMAKVEQEVRPYLGLEVMMWNPPWTLTLVMPLGLLACHWAHLIWLILSLTILLVGADFLWRFYGGVLRYRGISWFIALCFTPTILVLEMGQITPLTLLGLVGFLYFERQQGSFQARNPKSEIGNPKDNEPRMKHGLNTDSIPCSVRVSSVAAKAKFGLPFSNFGFVSNFGFRISDFLCGTCLVLVAIKPHLVYLIGLAIVAWVVDRRRWSVLLGAGAGLLVATVIPLAMNHKVLGQYWEALSQHPPSRFYSPTIGTFLR